MSDSAKGNVPLNQGILINKIGQAISWMQGYERERHAQENEKRVKDGLLLIEFDAENLTKTIN